MVELIIMSIKSYLACCENPMTYQDELLKNLIDAFEQAIISHEKHPCILSAQKLAQAKHELYKFMRGKDAK